MQLGESFKVGFRELLTNKTRAGLTMLGIVFGVGAVIAMVSIGEGAKEETLRQIELLGTNNIIVNRLEKAQSQGNGSANYSPGLNLKDAAAIAEIIPEVESVTPVRTQDLQVTYRNEIQEKKIIGTTPNYPGTFNSRMLSGAFFREQHMTRYSNVCVIGSGVKNTLFPFDEPVGKKIKIGDQWFDIIGVVSPKAISEKTLGTPGVRDFNQDIYIPITTMLNKYDKYKVNPEALGISWRQRDNYALILDRTSVDQVTVKMHDSEALVEAGALLSRILERRHYGIRDYAVILPEQLLAQKQKTQRIFNIVMGAIAGISLLVGGIGIMNIMLANILERTREIGIRRAVGATRNDILAQFIFEAVTISFVGGIVGILTGFLMTQIISSYAGWLTVISPIAIVTAFGVSVATGLVFGIYPAQKAAEKNPIESLRYE